MWQDEVSTWAPLRLCDERFPSYRFLPGQNPHPRRSPEGHSFSEPPPSEDVFQLASWHEEKRWLMAVDLYNNGYFWESHEYWEALWHAEKREGSVATFLQALIQTAAAHIKAIEGNLVGVEILASKSDKMLANLHEESVFDLMGVNVESFRVRRNNWFASILVGEVGAIGLFPFVHSKMTAQ